MTTLSPHIANDLKQIIKGDVLFDEASRNFYSTAACIYKIKPLGVVAPKSINDVVATVKYAHDRELAVIPRGAGTGLAGQALGFGIILDCAKYLNRIHELDLQNNLARVEPGVVLEHLNQRLAAYRKFFPPDPASGKSCVIGGMIATNASGAHGIKYGATKDYIRALKVVLSNGDVITWKSTFSAEDLKELQQHNRFAWKIYNGIRSMITKHEQLTRSRFPKVQKNSCGYNLLDVKKGENVDITKVITGSEGTLAVVVEAEIRIADLPKTRSAGLAYFSDYETTAHAVLESLSLEPAAIELMDKTLLDLATGKNPQVDKFLSQNAKALLLYEFEGEDAKAAAEKLHRLNHLLLRKRLALDFYAAANPSEFQNLWAVRREALNILSTLNRREKRTAFIEDVTVPVESLPRYVMGLTKILRRHNLEFSIYGHAGVGNVH